MGSHVVYNLYKIHQKIDTDRDRQTDRQIHRDRYTESETWSLRDL